MIVMLYTAKKEMLILGARIKVKKVVRRTGGGRARKNKPVRRGHR